MCDLLLLMQCGIVGACFWLDFNWLSHLLIQCIFYWKVHLRGFVSSVTIREWAQNIIIFGGLPVGDGCVAGDEDGLA